MQQVPYVCGLGPAIDVISGKWKALLLWAIAEKPCRFGELKRAVPGITEKMLIQHLRELEADGIVHREVFHEIPPKVVYSAHGWAFEREGSGAQAALARASERMLCGLSSTSKYTAWRPKRLATSTVSPVWSRSFFSSGTKRSASGSWPAMTRACSSSNLVG